MSKRKSNKYPYLKRWQFWVSAPVLIPLYLIYNVMGWISELLEMLADLVDRANPGNYNFEFVKKLIDFAFDPDY